MSLKLLSPDVRFYGQNAPNSISAGASPQTPLGEFTALPRPLARFIDRVGVMKEVGKGAKWGNVGPGNGGEWGKELGVEGENGRVQGEGMKEVEEGG